jgi:hypothetical protein
MQYPLLRSYLTSRMIYSPKGRIKKGIISLTHNLVFVYNRIDGNDHGNNHWQSDTKLLYV